MSDEQVKLLERAHNRLVIARDLTDDAQADCEVIQELSSALKQTDARIAQLNERVGELEAAALAVVEAWDFDEIGQVDGELIDALRKEQP